MKILSSAFNNDQEIPKEFTCEGENYNPPLQFVDIPPLTKSLALTVEDPDTPSGSAWYHWFVYNIPPETTQVNEQSLPENGTEGLANGGTRGYEGPCPPDQKKHRYMFTLYALDQILAEKKDMDVPSFRALIKGHVIEEAKLIGIYSGPAKRLKPL